MKYRREIDGLRAVAVVPVMFFHAGLQGFGGGYVGVDVFFVISGYLITSIILSEKDAGTFTITGFYERRARRILPALYFVMAACIPFALLWMYPGQLTRFADSIIAVSLFVSNFLFFYESGYFAPAAELKPLLHTWSLAVEEQFYVIFPVFMMAFWRVGKRMLVALIAIVAVLSFLFAQVGGNFNLSAPFLDPDFRWFAQPKFANFYLPAGRAWELLLGALVAFYLQANPRPDSARNQWPAVLGLALVLYAIIAFDASTPFPSIYTLAPVAGTALIILFATPATAVGRLLSLPVFVGIGLISYSAYLWHQPLFAFARLRSLDAPGAITYLLLSVAALILAWFSWRFVESPFRNRNRTSRQQIFTAATAATAVVLAVGVAGHFSNGLPQRMPDEAHNLLAYRNDRDPDAQACYAGANRYVAPSDRCEVGADGTPTIALLGDSHALELAYIFGERARQHGLSAKVLAFSSCVPATGLFLASEPDNSSCEAYNTEVFDYLAENNAITHVLLSARWTLYLEKELFNNGEGGVEHGQPAFVAPSNDEGWRSDEPLRKKLVSERYADSIAALLAMGKSVIVVYPVPEVGWNVPHYLARARMYGVAGDGHLSTSHERFIERNARAIAALDSANENPRLTRIRPARILCDSYVAGRCVAQLDGVPLYFDDDHLGNAGARLLVDAIFKESDLANAAATRE